MAAAAPLIPLQRTGRLKLVSHSGDLVYYVGKELRSGLFAIATSSVGDAAIATNIDVGGPQRLCLQASPSDELSTTELTVFFRTCWADGKSLA